MATTMSPPTPSRSELPPEPDRIAEANGGGVFLGYPWGDGSFDLTIPQGCAMPDDVPLAYPGSSSPTRVRVVRLRIPNPKDLPHVQDEDPGSPFRRRVEAYVGRWLLHRYPDLQAVWGVTPSGPVVVLPSWTALARACGRLLANPASPRVPPLLRTTYPTLSQMHKAIWTGMRWAHRHGPDGIPGLPVHEGDLREALFLFFGAKPEVLPPGLLLPPEAYLRHPHDTRLRLDTPFGRAFLEFLGDRPTWIYPGRRDLTLETTAEEHLDVRR
jgi:hypothetical protein